MSQILKEQTYRGHMIIAKEQRDGSVIVTSNIPELEIEVETRFVDNELTLAMYGAQRWIDGWKAGGGDQ